MTVSERRFDPPDSITIDKCERGFMVGLGSYNNRQLFAFSTLKELLVFLEQRLREEVDD
jgi:hypothetical protein